MLSRRQHRVQRMISEFRAIHPYPHDVAARAMTMYLSQCLFLLSSALLCSIHTGTAKAHFFEPHADHHHTERLLQDVEECGTVEMTPEEVLEAIAFEEAYFEQLELQKEQQEYIEEEKGASGFFEWIWNLFRLDDAQGENDIRPDQFSPGISPPTSPSQPTQTTPTTPAPPSAPIPTMSPPATNPPPGSSIGIPVYYHIIRPQNADGREPSDAQVEEQHRILNSGFEGSGFHFVWTGPASRTTNNSWYSYSLGGIGSTDVDMKTALRQGGKESLNVWINKGAGYCGYAYYPKGNAGGRKDGVVLNNLCFPGSGSSTKLGDTLVHEVGHWLGLPHSFEGGCSYPGDGIDDTPYHTKTSGCPSTRPNTCSSSPGLDPVDNYMNYSGDQCRDVFTNGQKNRMMSQWYTYRS